MAQDSSDSGSLIEIDHAFNTKSMVNFMLVFCFNTLVYAEKYRRIV